jgi:hypothetical protein
LYFLIEAFEPFSAFRLMLGVATTVLTIRLAVRGTLVASAEGIDWYTMLRTRRWPYETVSHFDLAVRTGRRSGSSPRVARIHLFDGRAQWLNGLEEVPESGPAFGRSPGGRASAASPDNLETRLEALNKIVAGLRGGRREREAG